MVGEARAQFASCRVVVEKAIELQVGSGRPVAAAEFEHVHAETGRDVEHGLEIGIGKTVGDHADLHGYGRRKGKIARAMCATPIVMAGRVGNGHFGPLPCDASAKSGRCCSRGVPSGNRC